MPLAHHAHEAFGEELPNLERARNVLPDDRHQVDLPLVDELEQVRRVHDREVDAGRMLLQVREQRWHEHGLRVVIRAEAKQALRPARVERRLERDRRL
jgi:hypothetical protein